MAASRQHGGRGAARTATAMETAVIASACLPEEIDTEEDDSEFDDKAHWGRRRRRSKVKRTAAGYEDKAQPKIDVFCIPRPMKCDQPHEDAPMVLTAEDLIISSDQTPNPIVAGSAAPPPPERSEKDTTEGREAQPSPGHFPSTTGSVDVEEPEPDRGLDIRVAHLTSGQADSVCISASMASGRPKRLAVLNAEAKQRAFMMHQDSSTVDPGLLRKSAEPTLQMQLLPQQIGHIDSTSPAESCVYEFAQERKPMVQGRKRKLELTMAKKKPATNDSNGTVRPKNIFFLTEEAKKQVIEIEAVASFKEQLRQQRERDMIFFGASTKANNPFFQVRAKEKKTGDAEGQSPERAITITDCDDRMSKPSNKLWTAKASTTPFPELQHIVPKNDLTASMEHADTAFIRRLDTSNPISSIDVIILDDDEPVGMPWSFPELTPDHTDVHSTFADFFWLMATKRSGHAAEDWLSMTEEPLLEKLSGSFGVKEKKLRKTLRALEAAREKRRERDRNLCLVDRYAPMQAAGMIGNKEPLRLMLSWLSAWKSGGDERARRSCFQAELFVFEDDDSDDDEESELCRLFILKGDIGSGKSASVYACAEELGFEVIEINAAQQRAGKNIVEIAGEATQSTRVLHATNPNEKKKKKKRPSKRRRLDESMKPSHLSLVLFEDIDLVFEDDKGFLSTLCSIAKHSKCPIIATCSSLPEGFPASPPALEQTLSKPSTSEFVSWLILMSVVERISLSSDLALRLASMFDRDIRRTLHFLQTYAEHLLCPSISPAMTISWSPSTVSLPGGDVIDVTDSQGDTPTISRLVPGWSAWSKRSFDLLTSNFVEQLGGGSWTMGTTAEEHELTDDIRRRRFARLEDVANVVDAWSLADEWMASANDVDDESFFDRDEVTNRAMDLRMMGLAAFAASPHADVLTLTAHPPEECVARAMESAQQQARRDDKNNQLTALRDQLELPLGAKGVGRIGCRFSLDYLPMIARLVASSEPQHESRRRASRRNHYLRDVLPDMNLVDTIRDLQCFERLGGDSGDADGVRMSPTP